MINKAKTPKHTMANLVIRLLFLVFTLLLIGLLSFSYQYSSKAINQEVERTLKQTASLIQNLFDYRLASMQAIQNSQANSSTLLKYIDTGSLGQTSDYFVSAEKAELASSPDFRFIVKQSHVFWDDGNSPFFGISAAHLYDFISEIAFYNSWHYTVAKTDIGSIHLLIRKVPIVNAATGEVIGQLYIGVVLDNNYALVEHLKVASNTEDIVLAVGNELIATTIPLESERFNRIIEAPDLSQHVIKDYLYNKIELAISDVETPLVVYSIQSNQNIHSLEKNYSISLLFSALLIIITAFFARFLIQKRVTNELNRLMSFARKAREHRVIAPFEGSEVYEFDHIGKTLEYTFDELIEKEKSFQDLFQYAVSPIIVWDSELNISRMNPAAEKAFEIKNTFSKQVFNEFQEKIKDKVQGVRTGSTLSGVNINISSTVYRWNISPIILENGVQSIIGQGLDITTLIEAERQSNLARIEAEKSANERADFLARISHEIRTPLNGILGISNLLKKSVTGQAHQKNIDVLLQSGEHLLAVLNDILDFSKIEQGKFKIVHNNFVLSNIVDSIENIYRPLCLDKGIQFKVQKHRDHDTAIRTDQVRLNQILFNLLSNAVKFTHIGSIKVSIKLASDKLGLTELSLVIEDTGIGISEKNLTDIFEPFVQSEKTSIREHGGSGLGLAIVKNLVDMLEGSIDIKSAEAYGTTVTVRIPVEVVDREKIISTEEQQENTSNFFSRQLTILIVEDNQTNAYIAQAFCKKYGMQVVWAKDGYEALENLTENKFDLILMDNQMPNLDGIEATQRIREMGINTPVIACTADGFDETRNAFMDAGADYVLVKPIKEEQFAQALMKYKQSYLV